MLGICCQMIYMKFQTYFVCNGAEKMGDVVLLEFYAFCSAFLPCVGNNHAKKDILCCFIYCVSYCL